MRGGDAGAEENAAFPRVAGRLVGEKVDLAEIAQEVGTPAFVYSSAAMRGAVQALKDALAWADDPLIAFAVKANPNGSILATFAGLGCGADVVSIGEYGRARAAGVPGERIVFSGVGKTDQEMRAALEGGLRQFNLESFEEAQMLSAVALEAGARARAALRINPDVAAGGHAKISTGAAVSKFGVAYCDAEEIFARTAALPGLSLKGVAVHIGSQIADLAPLEAAFGRVGALIDALRARRLDIQSADLGGGLAIRYDPALPLPPGPAEYGAMVEQATRGWNCRLIFEPGRLLVGEAGVLLTRVVRVKPGAKRPIVVLDAGMNDLLRPTLYDAFHEVVPVEMPSERLGEAIEVDLVGPVCESGDTFATARMMPRVEAGDILAIRTCGAYAATMGMSYNSRPAAAEVLVDDRRWAVVRKRGTLAEMTAGERNAEWL